MGGISVILDLVVKPGPNITNKFQTWYLVLGIVIITALNLSMTSLLTKQSLRETASNPGFELIAPVTNEAPVVADLIEPDITLSAYPSPRESRSPIKVRPVAQTAMVRYIRRKQPSPEKLLARSKEMFAPRIIRIPPPDPPVTFSAPRATYVAKVEYKQQPMSAHTATRDRDSFVANLVKKPWQFIKVVASKFH